MFLEGSRELRSHATPLANPTVGRRPNPSERVMATGRRETKNKMYYYFFFKRARIALFRRAGRVVVNKNENK